MVEVAFGALIALETAVVALAGALRSVHIAVAVHGAFEVTVTT